MCVLLSGFKDLTITPLETTARFLCPDLALVHGSQKIAGDKNPDGTLGQPRYRLLTLLA
jgi:hypothetical protein